MSSFLHFPIKRTENKTKMFFGVKFRFTSECLANLLLVWSSPPLCLLVPFSLLPNTTNNSFFNAGENCFRKYLNIFLFEFHPDNVFLLLDGGYLKIPFGKFSVEHNSSDDTKTKEKVQKKKNQLRIIMANLIRRGKVKSIFY